MNGEIEGREKSTRKEGSGKSLQLAALDLIDLLDGWNKVAFLSLFYGWSKVFSKTFAKAMMASPAAAPKNRWEPL